MNRKITLYMVVDSEFTKTNARIYTITTTKAQCEKYINLLLMVTHKEHYSSWCELRNLKAENNSSWEAYKKCCLTDKKYHIIKTKHKADGIALIFRLYNKCIPLGCGYESEVEYANIALEFCSNEELKSIADGLINGQD